MHRILHVYPRLMCGGTETVFFSLIKASDKKHFQYDILVQRHGQQEEKFTELGCNIITIPYLNTKQYHAALTEFFTNNKYHVVHCHIHAEMPIVLEVAYKAGVPHCISHAHNARIDIPMLLWPLRFFTNHKYEKYATDLFGCSELALKWLFPKRWREGKVIYNGIDLDAFKYDIKVRKEYRAKLGVEDGTKIIINVGRCAYPKNQDFILNRALELKDKKILFLLIGEGPSLHNLQKRIREEQINNVKMLGKRLDIAQWLCAADVFMFPSVYEGLGIVAIEAQANGLPVLSTDTIPAEADMQMGTFHRISLNDIAKWKDLLCEISIDEMTRKQKSEEAYKSQYNIQHVVKEVERIYLS